MASNLLDQAKAAQILGARWEHDPLRLWKPAPRQQMFLESTKSEVAILGATRSGKSDPLAALVASLARFGNPNPLTSYAMGGRIEIMDRAVSIWVIGLTGRLIQEGIQPKIVTTSHTLAETHPAFIPECEIEGFNINEQSWRLKNGSMLAFKCLRHDQEVLLADGTWKPIRDLAAGMRVGVRTWWGRGGYKDKYATIEARHGGAIKPLLRLQFTGGREIVCTPEHRIFNGLRWKPAGEYRLGDHVPYRGVPEPEAPTRVPYSPWLLGLLLGDGCLTDRQARLTIFDSAILDRAEREAATCGLFVKSSGIEGAFTVSMGMAAWRAASGFTSSRDARGYAVASNTSPYLDWLKEIGAWGHRAREKFVPDAIFRAPNEQVAEFISGLFAADGTMVKKDAVSLSTSSKAMAIGVQHLLDRFAVRSAVWYIRSTTSWRVVTQGSEALARFLAAIEWVKTTGRPVPAHVRRYIQPLKLHVKKIEVVPADLVYDISVPGPECFVVSGLPVHNSAEAGRDVFQSASRDLVAFDEICEWEVYKEATFRVPGGNRRLLIRLAATLLPPLGMSGGISWYYPQKIKPWWNSGNKENQTRNPDPYLDIFTQGMRDNPYINILEIERLESMFPPGSLEARIRIHGELLPSIGGTLAYPAFNRQIHVDPTITPAGLDPRFPLCLCVDFNVAPCIWEVGQKIDDTWYFFDEITFDECKIMQMVEEFRRRYPTHGAPLYIYGDQTGTGRNVQTGKSHYYLLQDGLKGYPVPIETKLPTTNPFVPDRLNAVNRKLSGTEGRVGLVFGPRCVEAIADCEEVLRDLHGGIKKTHHPESPYFLRTHAMDAIGYAVAYTDPVPQFVASYAHRLRSIPMPGYLGRGGKATRAGEAPASFDMDGRLRRLAGGGVRPPRRFDVH